MGDKKFNVIITKPILGDEKDLVFVHKKTGLATYPNKKYKISKEDVLLKDFDSEKKTSIWKKIIKNNRRTNEYLCVAKNKGKIIGFCLVLKKKNFNELRMIYILPEYQKMGIGQKILDKAISWLGRTKKITVTLAEYNESAINFYKKYGFVKTGVIKHTDLPNGKRMPEIELVLGCR